MRLSMRQLALRAMGRYPVYWAIPAGDVRKCAKVIYYSKRLEPDRAVNRIKTIDGVPTRYLRPALAAARAAFRAGEDDIVEPILSALEQRYPEASAVRVLRSDLHAFHARYEEALTSATEAQLLRPSDPAAVARTVRLSYQCLDLAAADQLAVRALRRFPRTSEVLWAVAKHCRSREQFQRLRAAWDDVTEDPSTLVRVVRPLAAAAARANEIEAAIDLYRRAIEIKVRTSPAGARATESRLEGRNAWQAIVDLCEVLDGAGIPYFFAAGTALGLIRAGRPLGADSDIDVGIFDAGWRRETLVELFLRHPRFDIETAHQDAKKIALRHRGGSPVDLFRFYLEDGRLWHDAVFVRWHNSPFEVVRRDIRGLSVPLPADPDRYLTENYGDWRTPNPAFDAFADAPNVETTWPEYLRFHLVRRAYKALVAGDSAAACRDLRRADEAELATMVRSAA